MRMGSDASPGAGGYMEQLAEHARRLQREAREAIARGDYGRASALIGDAELLAEDVHGLVDDFEQREVDRIMGHAAAEAEVRNRDTPMPSSRLSLRIAVGASLAMTLALVEC